MISTVSLLAVHDEFPLSFCTDPAIKLLRVNVYRSCRSTADQERPKQRSVNRPEMSASYFGCRRVQRHFSSVHTNPLLRILKILVKVVACPLPPFTVRPICSRHSVALLSDEPTTNNKTAMSQSRTVSASGTATRSPSPPPSATLDSPSPRRARSPSSTADGRGRDGAMTPLPPVRETITGMVASHGALFGSRLVVV